MGTTARRCALQDSNRPQPARSQPGGRRAPAKARHRRRQAQRCFSFMQEFAATQLGPASPRSCPLVPGTAGWPDSRYRGGRKGVGRALIDVTLQTTLLHTAACLPAHLPAHPTPLTRESSFPSRVWCVCVGVRVCVWCTRCVLSLTRSLTGLPARSQLRISRASGLLRLEGGREGGRGLPLSGRRGVAGSCSGGPLPPPRSPWPAEGCTCAALHSALRASCCPPNPATGAVGSRQRGAPVPAICLGTAERARARASAAVSRHARPARVGEPRPGQARPAAAVRRYALEILPSLTLCNRRSPPLPLS